MPRHVRVAPQAICMFSHDGQDCDGASALSTAVIILDAHKLYYTSLVISVSLLSSHISFNHNTYKCEKDNRQAQGIRRSHITVTTGSAGRLHFQLRQKWTKAKTGSPTSADRRHRSDADARSTGSAMTRAAWCRPRISMPHRSTPRTRPTRPTTSTCPLSSGVAQENSPSGAPRLDPEASGLLPTNRHTPGHVYCVPICRALCG